MKRALRRLAFTLFRDDLFHRAAWLMFGLLSAAMGAGLLYATLTPSTSGCTGPSSHVASIQLMCLLELPFLAISALGIARFVVSADSLLARSINDQLPDGGDLEGLLLALIVVYVPAILLTLALRASGVRGQRMPRVGKKRVRSIGCNSRHRLSVRGVRAELGYD